MSLIASLPYVRELLAEKQREMAKEGGVIMDGRDIGSVVFPHAEVKFFMTASPEECEPRDVTRNSLRKESK